MISKIISALFLGFIFSSFSHKETHEAPPRKPNIIFILADDLGYGDVGFNGQTMIKTPNIDRMARQGMIFTEFYAGSTVCGPSRSSLMTGQHTGHTTVRGNPRWTANGNPVDLKKEDITVAEELKRAGYTTGIIGKWGLDENEKSTGDPNRQGFDYFYGFRHHGRAHHYYPEYLWRNGDKVMLEGNVPEKKVGQYTHDLFTDEALDFVRRKQDTPFFLYLAYTIPHYELTVPEESKKPYEHLGWEKREMESGHYYHDKEGNTTYAGMVSRLDGDIGQMLDLLEELGIDNNTLVIFTSDNGHQYDQDFFNSNGPFKGKKRDLYEGGLRVPLVAWWPGTIKADTRSDHMAAFWDFLPTACEVAGMKPSAKTDGISFLPTLLGKNSQQKAHEYLYWEFNENQGPIQAVRMGAWKVVKFKDKPMELYNLEKDVGEEHNVAAEYPDMVSKMQSMLDTARTESPEFPLVRLR